LSLAAFSQTFEIDILFDWLQYH